MKYATGLAGLALVAAAYAAPAEVEKRQGSGTCTFFGFEYPCLGGGTETGSGLPTTPTTPPTSSSAPSAPASPSAEPTGGSGGGSSTGGASQYSGGSTASDVEDGNGCTPLTVIFARGTSEGGNIGSIAGPPMFEALLNDLGAEGVTLQGVNYPASSAGNANCGSDGSSEMAQLAQQALSDCPNTKIALSGYSQGACVVHRAAEQLDGSSIDAAVVFGDPFNGQSIGSVPESQVKSFCASGDSICAGGLGGFGGFGKRQFGGGLGGHLSYGDNAQEAATFIEQATGVN